MSGGAGNDTFLFRSGEGRDVITDFKTGGQQDYIDLSFLTTINTFEELLSVSSQSGADTLITLDPNNSITLNGTSLSSHTAQDFLF